MCIRDRFNITLFFIGIDVYKRQLQYQTQTFLNFIYLFFITIIQTFQFTIARQFTVNLRLTATAAKDFTYRTTYEMTTYVTYDWLAVWRHPLHEYRLRNKRHRIVTTEDNTGTILV